MASIYQRSGIYYIKFRRNGKWIYRSLETKNKCQALTEKARIEAALADENPQPAIHRSVKKDIGFDQLAQHYTEWASKRRRPATVYSKQRAIKLFQKIHPEITTLKAIKPKHVEVFKSTLA